MKLKTIAALLLSLLLVVPAVMAEEAAAPILEVHQLPIGYADGYFIRCGDIELLVDGGQPNPRVPNDDVINALRALGVEELDACIITHWHLDHCMNMNVVLSEFGTDSTVTYGISDAPPEYLMFEEKNISLRIDIGPVVRGVYQWVKVDDVIQLGPLTITCIGPEELSQNGRCNADSMNFVLQYGTRRMLFTGDYAQSSEINKRHPELCSDVDVLKFPHHGGKPFEIGNIAARNVSPEYVLVPSLLNNYQIYCFFNDRGAKIARENVLTNREGHVVILTDGGDYIEARTMQNPADYAPKAN